MHIISNIFFTFGILVFLLIYQTSTTLLVIGFISVLCFVFIKFSNKKINQWSVIRQSADIGRIKFFKQGLTMIEEIKLKGAENYFYNLFRNQNFNISKVAIKQNLLAAVPFYFLELIGVFAILIISIYLVSQNRPPAEIIITLGLFTAAAFKIIPSANRILNGYTFLKYSWPVIELYHNHIFNLETNKENLKNKNKNIFDFNNEIYIKNLNFSYQNQRQIINLNIDPYTLGMRSN